MQKYTFSVLLLLVGGFTAAANASFIDTPQARVEILSEKEAATPGETQRLGVLFKPKDGWHVYWKNPGDSGLPPRAEFSSQPMGSVFGALEFPTPERITVGPLVNFAYTGDVLYPLSWKMPDQLKPGENVTVTVNLKWLICKEECVPGKTVLNLTLPVIPKDKFLTSSGTHGKLFKEAIASLPVPSAGKARLVLTDEQLEIFYSGNASKNETFFFPEGEYGIAPNAKQTVELTKEGMRLTVPRTPGSSPIAELRGVLKTKDSRGVSITEVVNANLTPSPSPKRMEGSLVLMLVFAFIGGLILNLMPCILPVLSIKVLGIAAQSGEKSKEIRNHGVIFTLGVLVSFWILAAILLIVRASGTTLGWGFQLQSPVFIATLGLLFFLMALNLFGFFEIGGRLMGVGGNLADKESYRGSFFTGVLTTVAATPCSAPFMGTALAFGLTQPAWIAVTVLTFLGLGLSFPYLLFSFLPGASKMLPRPGAWMKTLKEVLAFPLLASVVWLVGVLGNQVGTDGIMSFLAVLILVTCAIWLVSLKSDRFIPKVSKWIFIGISLALAFMTIAGLSAMRKTHMAAGNVPGSMLVHEPWKEWSPAVLEKALTEKKTVLVNITADWCVTCKVNETIVFERSAVQAALRFEKVVALLADWTNGDRVITDYMAKYGRNSIPVYLIYKNGSREPKVLPQILSVDALIEDLK